MNKEDYSTEIKQLQYQISIEDQKLQQYKLENKLRKFNYLPFIMNLLTSLEENKKLDGLIEKAKAKSGREQK